MTAPQKKTRNVILCEDVRDETGKKKSLMGVLAGDIIVGEFPATISLAVYFEYVPDDSDGSEFSADFSLMIDSDVIARGAISAPIEKGNIVTMVLPRGLVMIQKPSTFRIMLGVKDHAEFELLAKKIIPPD